MSAGAGVSRPGSYPNDLHEIPKSSMIGGGWVMVVHNSRLTAPRCNAAPVCPVSFSCRQPVRPHASQP